MNMRPSHVDANRFRSHRAPPAERVDGRVPAGFAGVAHRAGYPTSDLEDLLGSLATALGLEAAQISATPTLLELSFGLLPHQRSYTLRVRPTAVDLDAIGRLEDLARDAIDGRLTVAAALAGLEEIEARPLHRQWYVELQRMRWPALPSRRSRRLVARDRGGRRRRFARGRRRRA